MGLRCRPASNHCTWFSHADAIEPAFVCNTTDLGQRGPGAGTGPAEVVDVKY
jgi:hypothetical protein